MELTQLHNSSLGHVEHHAETYDSMKLKTDDAKWMASPPAQRLNVGKSGRVDNPFTTEITIMVSSVPQCQSHCTSDFITPLSITYVSPIADPWRGTAFTWPSTALMFAQCVPTVFPVFHLLGWSLPATSIFYFFSMALHGLVWNAIHPGQHSNAVKLMRHNYTTSKCL